MTVAIKLFPDTYVDSVVQLRGMRAMREVDGVEWASAAMATPANVETLRAEGVDPMQVADAGSNDFFLVVRASDGLDRRRSPGRRRVRGHVLRPVPTAQRDADATHRARCATQCSPSPGPTSR